MDVATLLERDRLLFAPAADFFVTLLVLDGLNAVASGAALACAAAGKPGLAWKLLFPLGVVGFCAVVFVGTFATVPERGNVASCIKPSASSEGGSPDRRTRT